MFDLGVKYTSSGSGGGSQAAICRRAFELGWDCIVWNMTVIGRSGISRCRPPSIKALTGQNLVELASSRQLGGASSATSSRPFSIADFRQLSRITLVIDDIADAQVLSTGNEVLNAFDIVAATPGTAAAFAYLCKTADVDIIHLNFGAKLNFALNKKLMDEAVRRGIHFEITYTTYLQSTATRKYLLAGTKGLIRFLKGGHIIFTSGTDSYQWLRSPKDVESMGVTLNLTAEQARAAVDRNCRKLLQRAAARKLRNIPLELVNNMAEFRKKRGLASLTRIPVVAAKARRSHDGRSISMQGSPSSQQEVTAGTGGDDLEDSSDSEADSTSAGADEAPQENKDDDFLSFS